MARILKPVEIIDSGESGGKPEETGNRSGRASQTGRADGKGSSAEDMPAE
jgi:hypothetical protein